MAEPEKTYLRYKGSTGRYYRMKELDANEVYLKAIHDNPSSMFLDVGTPIGGVVGDLAIYSSNKVANIVSFGEVAGTPGFTFRVQFTSVVDFTGFVWLMYYQGSATHVVETQIYNYTLAAWVTLDSFVGTPYYITRHTPVLDASDFISAGVVQIRINHTSMGNATHNMFIDYVALTKN